jgi:hypothetical protein
MLMLALPVFSEVPSTGLFLYNREVCCSLSRIPVEADNPDYLNFYVFPDVQVNPDFQLTQNFKLMDFQVNPDFAVYPNFQFIQILQFSGFSSQSGFSS